MSYSTSYRSPELTREGFFLALALIVGFIGWQLDWVPKANHWLGKHQTAVKVVEQTEALRQQQGYQQTLTHNIQHRVPRNAIVLRGGQVAVVKGATANTPVPDCTFRCATVRSIPGGLAVSLPVGFSYQDAGYQLTSDPKRYTFSNDRVLELTYWDPTANQPRTLTSGKGVGSVTLPTILHQRSVADLRVGEGGYIENTDIIETGRKDGAAQGVVSSSAGVSSMPSIYGSYSVRITRTEPGVTVCAADGITIFEPAAASRSSETRLLPAKLVSTC
jgi:hypothetical protein